MRFSRLTQSFIAAPYLTIVALAIAVTLVGCQRRSPETDQSISPNTPILIEQYSGNDACTVTILSSEYDHDYTGPTPSFEVLWDGQSVYEGITPRAEKSPPTHLKLTHSNPLTFIEITTPPGEHSLEIRCEDRTQRIEWDLQPGETKLIHLNGIHMPKPNDCGIEGHNHPPPSEDLFEELAPDVLFV